MILFREFFYKTRVHLLIALFFVIVALFVTFLLADESSPWIKMTAAMPREK